MQRCFALVFSPEMFIGRQHSIAMQKHDIDIAFVCPSVHPSRADIVLNRVNRSSRDQRMAMHHVTLVR